MWTKLVLMAQQEHKLSHLQRKECMASDLVYGLWGLLSILHADGPRLRTEGRGGMACHRRVIQQHVSA